MSRRRRRKPLPENTTVTIENLSQDGRGVTHIDNKAVFIDGALPGEEVMIRYLSSRKKFDEACVEDILKPSSDRVEPACEWFSICGGCSLQHLSAEQQIVHKHQSMLETLQRVGKVTPATVQTPLIDDIWGYRRKARLGAKYVAKKGRVLVGFREKRNPFLADIHGCKILHPAVGEKLDELSDLIGALSRPDRIPQIEVAIVEDNNVLVFRHMEALTEADYDQLRHFSEVHNFSIYLQSGGPDTVVPLDEKQKALFYRHDHGNITIQLQPLDFFQINSGINAQMLDRAIELLELTSEHEVLDLFCGLGNFTLPIATRVKQVTGVEGSSEMVERARQNASDNDINNAGFFTADLMNVSRNAPWLKKHYDRVLLDPPRSGAREILADVVATGTGRIVYISCHPGTLARDADILVNEYGYQLETAGVMDMFPHTAHVESVAVFSKI